MAWYDFLNLSQQAGQIPGAIGDYFATQAQTKALEQSRGDTLSEAKKNRRLLQQMLGIEEALRLEGAPTRQLQYGATQFGLEGLQSEATRQPGTSDAFQRALSGGTRSLTRNLAQYGISPESGTFGRGAGELAGSLTAADMERITGILQFLSGQAPNTLPSAAAYGGMAQGYGQTASGLVSQGAGYTRDIGAVKGSLYSSLGNRFGQPIQEQAQFDTSNDRLKELLKNPEILQLLKNPGILALVGGG